MEINDNIAKNIIFDFRKTEVSLEDKSKFINDYINEHGITQREFSRRFNIPHSTVQDWCSLRQSKLVKSSIRVLTYNNKNLDSLIERLTYLLSKDYVKTDKTIKRLEDLREEINKILLYSR